MATGVAAAKSIVPLTVSPPPAPLIDPAEIVPDIKTAVLEANSTFKVKVPSPGTVMVMHAPEGLISSPATPAFAGPIKKSSTLEERGN